MLQSIGETLKTLRNNWKKSVFGSVCLFYAGNFLFSKYKENLYLRVVCQEAKAFGDVPLPTDARPRHVTVILNPAANDGKCKAQFDKYCGPLLNLAGLKVGIIRTEKEGQAKDLMEIMDNTDGVLVAGGDGTLTEVVTGLLRRPDRERAARRFPVAAVPLGRTNGTAASLLAERDATPARRITQATMALIRETLRPLDVIQVQAIETEEEVPGRPVFLLSDIWWGAHRDVHAATPDYWYWGALKHRVAYIFSVFRDLTWRCDAEMEYTAYCAGCSRCRSRQPPPPEQGAPAARWWARFIRRPAPTPTAEPERWRADNEQCGVWRRQSVSGVEWRLRTDHGAPGAAPGLHLTLGPEAPSWVQFVSEGWRRVSGEQPAPAQTLAVGQLRLTPAPQVRDDAACRRWFSFDGEQFEVRPVEARLLPRAVHVFAAPAHTTAGES